MLPLLAGNYVMLIGYTLLDPLIVLAGTFLALYYAVANPVRLMGWLPAALTVYFFIPFVTLLTLWQTVPLVLSARAFLKGRLFMAKEAQPIVLFFILAFIASICFGLLVGQDVMRAAIRAVYYVCIFALAFFCYEMARRPGCYETFLKGLALTGLVLGAYGAYQIFADYLGLPVRGIVRSTTASDMAYEYGIVRINSLANEPKRLGYVLFVCGMASLFFARLKLKRRQLFNWTGYGVLFMSLFTFSGSYFLSVFLFGLVSLILYPGRFSKYILGLLLLVFLVALMIPELGVFDAIQHGYERRAMEIEIGLDGNRVYRQEFYAWDFLINFPVTALWGVGLGQYYMTLFDQYGVGVGINEYGGLVPLNSTFLEMVFDFGFIVSVLFYGAMGWLILKLRKAGETYLCLALLFLVIQSFTILTMQFMVMFAGVALGRIAQLRSVAQPQRTMI